MTESLGRKKYMIPASAAKRMAVTAAQIIVVRIKEEKSNFCINAPGCLDLIYVYAAILDLSQ